MADSPYPNGPMLTPDQRLMVKIADDVSSIRRCVHRVEERLTAPEADSIPPMRPRLDTHRGLGAPEDVDLSSLAEKAAEKAIKTKEGTEAIAAMTERRRFVVGTIKATISVVAGAVGIKALEWLWATGHHP